MGEPDDQQLLTVIGELETAYNWHEQWYKNVLRTLVARAPAKPADMLSHAHQVCPFGQWYARASDSFLQEQPHFAEIRDKHERMHALAAGLLQHHIQVTGSIGVAAHDASRTVEESLGIADKAMYEAKALGRNRVVVLD